MGIRDTIGLDKFIIKYDGIFDLKGLYNDVYNWLTARKFEVKESVYKNKPPELEIKWSAERKKTHYIKDVIGIFFRFWNLKDVEIVKDGKKIKMQSARVFIRITPKVELGYNDIYKRNWWDHPFLIKLKEFINTWILRKELEFKHADALYYETVSLVDYIKSKLNFTMAKGAY